MTFAIAPHALPSIPIAGSDMRFPVHRIYCIGRNYADHAREMGAAVDRGNPIFFAKPADAIVIDDGDVPYPSATAELHHEVEMVIALASGGRDIPVEHALEKVYAYGIGLDLTRRDLQATAKKNGSPWDTAKGFDCSAPVSSLHRASDIGHPANAEISLHVNGTLRQQADIADMVFSVAEIIHELSKFYELTSGDLIFSGTPAGVASLSRGDRFRAELHGIAILEGRII
ncbi:MAG: fumarylacetoacetate hydrolase family protein [Dokdonella sp.]|jgi:fumarylpyruvate hydrolase|uniref:fumarylacetoacetate hydrolase family protein n=2 Tax=Dokdonella sp. TaxID=2291710 RepID=UPI001B45EC85|nr:fumarylacetoacetate hydrolase family protein [Dokdonella sp.]MCC6439984.1 fumarylacetoacetate hydrolase family protein [Rhodanobacteraceae bacterium]MBK8122988.1 fumarylacetoacetate hydrolase family protein [Dokdonella sp.]MBP6326337.1 fumarylacetoacetate hydrolase family protein [Dokdonella sp.]MBP6329081.1 fumarylacetoacetate hydrolase family protein [Dokdonella sp.]HNV07742.1 fumarylacetoacetate hydrolase family protein [Dokdonella sp.]